jgi:hypothetical protein
MTSSQNGPWEQYLVNVLRSQIERLRGTNRFGAFHPTLMKIAQAQVDFLRTKTG